MNKTELIENIAALSGLTNEKSQKALEALLDCVTTELRNGGSVQLIGFGTFSVDIRPEHMGMNPQKGIKMKIPEKKVAKWKAGRDWCEIFKINCFLAFY
ncbi:MAG: HU family DNA-binding protein [Paludibacteraceae bacterium]|nr:HU family DNA-binding protein [Paludibacteraceae bacterium]